MRNDVKHIVFILGSYYPNYSAVGKCLGNIADVLVSEYNVTIICTKTSLSESEIFYHNNQKIMRVMTNYNKKRMTVEKNLEETAGLKNKRLKILKQILRIHRFTKTLISKETIDPQLVLVYEKALQSVREPIDFIIPTCTPFESVITALEYKKNNSDVEIIPYLFDLFAENLNLNRLFLNRELKRKKNMWLENEMFKKSKAVLYVDNWTSYIKKYYSKYTKKTIEVGHPLLLKINEQKLEKIDDKIHIVYTGIVDLKNRNPKYALKILTQLKSEQIVIDFYAFGSGKSVIDEYAERYANRVIAHGKVSSNEAGIARNTSNILLSIGNVNTSQIPSKLFEYMSTGKAILHFAHTDTDPVIQVLNNYPVKMIVIRNQKVDIEIIESFIFNNCQINISFDKIFKNYSMDSPKVIAKILNNTINEKNVYNKI